MRLTSITINNFKGIKQTRIDLIPRGANIYTLIGLNESGKTTILEAISTFNIKKDETGALYGVNIEDVKPTAYVPKSLKSNFTGEITITVEVEFEGLDKQQLVEWVRTKTKWKIANSSIPDRVTITRGNKFENSDLKSKIYTIGGFNVKATPPGGAQIEPIKTTSGVWDKGTDFIVDRFPEILYFPTFIFNQPEKIVLNPSANEKPINRLYREILGSVASSLDRPLDLQKHVVDRILGNADTQEKVLSFFMLPSDKQQQIEASLNEISAHITQTVFGSWTKIFGGDFSEREIVLKLGVQNINEAQEVYIQFAIKDRKSTYDIAERSLGFRWFFSFLLFTIYRKSNAGKSTLFLLDEPASNLHARAQMQLLENLSKIAENGNQIIYSTHSHYLINPEWLDQAYIISNRAIDYENVDDSKLSFNSGETLITAEKYRSFVGKNPDKINYFQPVLDTLDVVPSKLDLTRKSVLMEGKGDYFILEYGRRVLMGSNSDIHVVPTRGATGMDELIGLFLGWGIPFLVCLDDDKEGRLAQKKYIESWGLSKSQIWTLKDIDDQLANKEISGILDNEDLELIQTYFSLEKKPSKSQIQLFFSENLAKKQKLPMSASYSQTVSKFEVKLAEALKSIGTI